MYKNGQKAVRLREIAARLTELSAADQLITGPDRASPDGRQQLAEIAVERRQLRDERDQLLADPDPEPAGIREQMDRMWLTVLATDDRLREWRRQSEIERDEEREERRVRQAEQDRWFQALAIMVVIEAVGLLISVALASAALMA